MPVKEIGRRGRAATTANLKKVIVEEWRCNSMDQDKPIILIDSNAPGGTMHVFVIWEQWDDLDQMARSEVIIDACEEVLGKEKTLTVTVAMGLTKAEAKRMNIAYE